MAILCAGPVAWSAEQQQTEPLHKHHDSRHGHDHYYPDRGAIVRDLPVGTIGTSYAGVSYRYHDGIWLEPRGPAFMVVAPPIGLVAPTLPLYSTVVTHGPDSYLYCNDTYYKPRPDLGGYEVVNDPTLEPAVVAAPPAPDALVGGQMPGGPPAAAAAGAVVPAVAHEAGFAGGAMPGGGAAGGATPAAAVAGPGAAGGPAAVASTTATAATAVAAAGTQKVPKVFLYPKNGQTAEQQARDRYDCYRFAVAQSGFDPMRTTAAAITPTSEQQSDFDRAQGACFEGHGYSNR
jgi:hypothetical protein